MRLAPDRLAVFGYAHVPWMRKHQQKIDTATLPDAAARLDQFTTITERLEAAGYRPIGLDHFAKPDDSLSRCLDQGRLRRNFQGYTADQCSVLLGFGASALGLLPGGYLQNVSQIGEYRRLLAADLDEIAATHGDDPGGFAGELARLDELESSGVVRRDGRRIVVAAECRPLARIVAAAFDAYLEPAAERHSRAI